MRTTDNNCGRCELNVTEIVDCSIIGNKNLHDLVSENPSLLIFPPKLGQHDDGVGEKEIFGVSANKLTTNNIMGFVGVNNTQITICSRFQKNETENDNFLHYMLQSVFALNIVDLKLGIAPDSIYDKLLFYIFPSYLNKALSQGLYKEYQNKSLNDSNIKGVIDISRHLKINQPFLGNIAYKTREHAYDNRITQLVRHTIEYITQNELSNGILTSDYNTRSSIVQITSATRSYSRIERNRVIEKNRKIVNHAYYSEYEMLRKICLQILRKEGVTYGKKKDEVYGLLFDGAWLWEEYLNTLLSPIGYIHPENKRQKNKIYLFKDDHYARYPDFYHKIKMDVLDAKYKHLGSGHSELERNDIHQLIAYMHVLRASSGGLIYPSFSDGKSHVGILNGFEGEIFKYGFKIPVGQEKYKDFKSEMMKSEMKLIDLCGNL